MCEEIRWSTPTFADFVQFIENNLKRYGASTIGRAKPLASFEVVEDLLYFLWTNDEFTFKHPRARVQLSFSLLLMIYGGYRPGEFTESSAWRHSNDGFSYKDFRLLKQNWKGEIRWVLMVTLRHRKNHRGVEKDK